MKPEWAPGKYANWIAEPKTKINHKPGTFEWVKLAAA
jgi:benzoyl-CoA 2,3-dioxygenase component B